MKLSHVLAVLVFLLLIGCSGGRPGQEQDLLRMKSSRETKKVIFILVDSLMASSIDEGIAENRLPTFKYLVEHGQYYRDMVSSFPTMSVSIDSSLLTGAYPDVHRVPGLTWYSSQEQRVINYGTGPMEVLRNGIDSTLADALIHLNGKHLNTRIRTIYEELDELGLTSGTINGLIYRGNTEHKLTIPKWIRRTANMAETITVKGPDFLTMGALSNPLIGKKKLKDGLVNKLGFNNGYAIGTLNHLIATDKLPDFLLVYMPDLDQSLHQKGPADLDGVEKVDRQLQQVIRAFGSPEKALREAVIIVAGDSGMTQLLPANKGAVIELPLLLGKENVMRTGESATENNSIILAVNETMAYVYSLEGQRLLEGIASVLRQDPRIDFIAWKAEDWVSVVQGGSGSRLRYKRNGGLTDAYQQSWQVEQDYSVLDLQVNERAGTVAYREYPDAMRRLSAALQSHEGSYLVVTAKPGYELADMSSPRHVEGGGHGSIRRKESLVPLIICGTDLKPDYLRMVDLKPFLLKLLTDVGEEGRMSVKNKRSGGDERVPDGVQ
ncbi:alkaline phosphatase family protein [Paenibacillus sp. J5C_2022]|uniref:alkaline phosphatase family protein n=1 Tax=Paenibacillus sp. J5C2022 TaxID=2977129 RepID=UPI0021D22600|nr:alkaline phosphatase family protein [Paenibacillus sp. J5C2022]MCU6708230.1 alkaline phosphatase family protein [Paenibacillus sp. J5C2022]